tara:strand:- start:1030 stop:1290 length:261 start_codon:yes stop_codon:yes gene_type:complete
VNNNCNMEEKDFKIVLDKAIEYLYEFYECDHSIRVAVSLRPSEPWHGIPEELLTKEQFIETINGGKWELALNVLINYILKNQIQKL